MEQRMKTSKQLRDVYERIFYGIVLVAALASIVFLFAIIISLFVRGVPIFAHTGFFDFIFGTKWHPDKGQFEILPLILGSFLVTVIALFIGVPLGVGSALYIAEIASPREREILKPIIELLAGIPSVIFGLFALVFLAPIIAKLYSGTGQNALTAGIILGVMIIPIISSISEDALSSVPRILREASFGLGANSWETIIRVTLPSAKSGIITSTILGFGRAVGETMVVLMVAGNSAIIPTSIFSSVRPMTSAIAGGMGESHGEYTTALFGIGIILFLITFISNIITEWVRGNIKKQHT